MKVRRYTANWKQRNPEKIAAHRALNEAIRSGQVTRQPCEVCGAENTHGHHDDYTQPLTVRWLCPTHHKRAHGITRHPPKPRKSRSTKPDMKNQPAPKRQPAQPRTRAKPAPWSHTKKTRLHSQAVELRAAGKSYTEIADALHLSRGHAYKIINQPSYR